MRSRRGARWGTWWGGLLVAGSLAPAGPVAPPPRQGDAAAIREKVQLKIKAASEVLEVCRAFLLAPPAAGGAGAGTAAVDIAEQIQFWSGQLTDAKLEATDDHAERVAILAEAFDRAREFEAQVKELLGNDAKGMDRIAVAKASYYRADLEVRLLREQARPAGRANPG